jgi:hypothetical protein
VSSFTDTAGKWYEAAVSELTSRKIISGIGNGLFAGERSITRAEFVAIIINALGLPANRTGTVFADVPGAAWFAGAVGMAHEHGIIAGIGNGLFAPHRPISRKEAMVIVKRMAQIAGFDGDMGCISAFSDSGDVNDWALEAVQLKRQGSSCRS